MAAAVWGSQAASTPNWQKSYAIWSFTRALSVFFGIAYITVVCIYIFITRVKPLFSVL